MKLSIIIPQYKESEQVLSSALWSIANQKGIDLNNLEVIIVNDASDVVPSKEFLKKFPYKITLLRAEVLEWQGNLERTKQKANTFCI